MNPFSTVDGDNGSDILLNSQLALTVVSIVSYSHQANTLISYTVFTSNTPACLRGLRHSLGDMRDCRPITPMMTDNHRKQPEGFISALHPLHPPVMYGVLQRGYSFEGLRQTWGCVDCLCRSRSPRGY